jgi:glutaredoxin-like protein
MSLISQKDQDHLRQHFAKELEGDVDIVFFTQHESPLNVPAAECEYCAETRQIMEELAALSDKIHVTVHDFVADQAVAKEHGIDKIPATVITGRAKGKVRYFGIPSGYEFSSLIEDIVDVSKGRTSLDKHTLEELAKLSEPVNIQVFVTPT